VELLILVIKIGFVLQLALGLASLCTWIERKGSALIQDRVGANRAGANFYFKSNNPLLNVLLAPLFWGLRILGKLGVINTLFCDSVKAIFKEDFVPEGTSRFMHALAPIIAALPIFMAFAVLPLAPDFEIAGYAIRPQVVSLSHDLLFIFAMGSLAVYGVTLAGWTSNNKFSMLGGLRAAAQLISYELAMGLVFVAMVMIYGTFELYGMVMAQSEVWGVFKAPLAFLILFIVGMAETKRAPFDLPEAESELAAGYFTEYSGMKFLLFWLGEFAEIALFSILLVLLFFGGWHLPLIDLPAGVWWAALIGHAVLLAKVVFFCVLQIVIRWTLPRFRYDQLMNLGWKILIPVSLVNLAVTALVIVWMAK
jgi:NADH-quinone oxidoreductase subunit H